MNGIQLKECRKAKGMSQATLSRLLGVTQQAVGKWETGRSNPDPEMLVRLAEVLGTTTDYLLGLHTGGAEAEQAGRRGRRGSKGRGNKS